MSNELRFEWDNSKNKANIAKHNISFDEAQTVFGDPNARTINDTEHSSSEERFIILGLSEKPKLLVVCHCYRAADEIIRIISARKATANETKQYNEYL